MRLPSLAIALAAAIAVTGSSPAVNLPALVDPLFAKAQGDTRAVLLIKDGQVVAKRYAPGYGDRTRFVSWSMAKTVTAMLVGALVADGRLQLDAPVPLAEWRGAGDPRAKVTLRDLLQMRSGLAHVEVGQPIENSDTNQALFVSGPQAVAAYALRQPLRYPPGTKFEYSSLTTVILSELITRTLTSSRDPRVRAQAYQRFAQERLFGPAGITSAMLEFDGSGTQIGGSLIYMTLDDWGRFGQVLLTGRGANGQPVLTSEWRAFLISPSPTNGGYGGQTWLNRPSGIKGEPLLFPGAPADAIAAQGHLAQHVVAVPSKGMVLVRLGNTPESDFRVTNEAIGKIIADVR